MKKFSVCGCIVLLAMLLVGLPNNIVSNQTTANKDAPPPDERGPLQVTGRTQCIPGCKALIAPVPLHPVEMVLVVPGDIVEKDQLLVKLDDDEPRADLRAKEAAVENAELAEKEARRHFEMQERTFHNGALSMRAFHDVRAAVLKAETDVGLARAVRDTARAELDHYYVTAPIDGVISWIDVCPGMVSRPGTTVWGEILDLSEMDVRCELTPEQADRVAVDQTADVHSTRGKRYGTGTVINVGISADKRTGLVPVTVRLANPDRALRCEVPVRVRFNDGAGDKTQK